jgi:hypothetical protein
MLEFQNFLKMKDFFAENFGNFWKKVVLRKISGTFIFEKVTSTSPPSPPSPTFSGKIFAFRKNILGGPGTEWGPNFGIHPPNRKPVGTALQAVQTQLVNSL